MSAGLSSDTAAACWPRCSRVGFSILNLLDPQPFVKQGKLCSLAVTGAKRSVTLPDVPTLMESGVRVEAYLYQGLFAPAGTPAPVVNKLNAEITRIISEPQTMTGAG
jgi:tripartite-type tricarboxylate transporter receptor subunit TctC